MNTLKHIINGVVWLLLGLYAFLMILLHIPAIQRQTGSIIASAIGRKLGTEVSIGRVDLGFLNRIIIDDVRMLDQQGEELLRAARLTAKLELPPLTEGRISISSAQLFGASIRLNQSSKDAKPNYQFILDSLASKDGTSKAALDLRINSFILRHSAISYDRYDATPTPGRLNLAHLNLKDISAHVVLKTLTNDSLNLNIKKLGFQEQSGLKIERLSMKLEAGRQGAHLHLAQLKMPDTELRNVALCGTYQMKDNRIETNTLQCTGNIGTSRLTPADFKSLLPALGSLNQAYALSGILKGERDDLYLQSLKLTSADDELVLSGQAIHLTDQCKWEANIERLNISPSTIKQIAEGVHATIPPTLARLGNIQLTGTVSGKKVENVNARHQLNTDAGSLTLLLDVDHLKTFKGNIETSSFNLQQIIDNQDFGSLATNLNFKGNFIDKKPNLTIDGTVDRLDYKGYAYQGINIDGTYKSGNIAGQLSIDDPNIRLSVEGAMQNANLKDIKLTASIRHLAPAAIHLTDRWGNAIFDADVTADFNAHTLSDAVGNISINQLTMQSDEQVYHLDQLLLTSGFDNGRHYLHLESDFADAELDGFFEYGTLARSFTNFIGSKLPTLPGLPAFDPRARNEFSLQALVRRSDWLQHLLGVPLELHQPLSLSGKVSDASRTIILNGEVNSFSYNGQAYRNGRLNIHTPGDSLRYDVSVTKLMDNGDPLELSIKGNAADNRLFSSFHWDNHGARPMSGTLNARAHFLTDAEGRQTADIGLAPSHLNVNDTLWTVDPCTISYHKNWLEVNGFNIHHDQQHLTIDGRASESAADIIVANLRDIDVEYILDLVNFHSVDFSGLATGQATVRKLFGQPEAEAKLMVNHFQFQQGRMGVLDAHANWNVEKKQIEITAVADDGPDALTYINGYVQPSPGFIDLNIRAAGTHIDFVRSFTNSFISHIDGHANGEVRLMGPLSTINLTGQLVVNGQATVTPLNCTYTLPGDTIRLVPDEIEFRGCPIYDVEGHQGVVNGFLHHQHLTRLSYDLSVSARNLLAYDFRDFGNEVFYGTVYGTGDVGIHGRDGQLVIDIDVTPQRGSTFVYNASNPDAIADQKFIVWHSQQDTDGTSDEGHEHAHHAGASQATTDTYLNFRINCTPNATLRLLMDANTGDYITLNGNGELRATYYNKGAFNIFGTYAVDHGTYGITIQELIKKNFTFLPGSTIVFGGDPYDAALNLQARYTVPSVSLSDLNIGRSFSSSTRVNCLMNIGGQAKAPRVTFDLDLPNVNADEQQMIRSIINSQQEMNQQVIYLLGIGRFYNQGANNAETQSQQSQTQLAMQSLLSGTLSSQLNNVLSNVIKSNDWNFGANISTGDEGWNNAEYEGLVSGRLLNNRLLIDGQFGYRDNTTTATPSFIGDFDIRYLLHPNGNLALKVYNQTNDRYFTHSALNTQGIGLIMKKDFNGLRDLFSSKRKAKKKKTARKTQNK